MATGELLGLNLSNYTVCDPFFNLQTDPHEYYTPDYNTFSSIDNLLPYYHDPSIQDDLLMMISSPDDDEDCFGCYNPYNYPKRQKITRSCCCCNNTNISEHNQLEFQNYQEDSFLLKNCFNGYYHVNPSIYNDFSSSSISCIPDDRFLFPGIHHEVQKPLVYSSEGKKHVRGVGDEGTNNLSAQSIAARQRRRKISEKTQELGKLIPGGNKMNTAEMFQAAFKYVKFLQAQVGILQLIHKDQESNKDEESHGYAKGEQLLQLLLASTDIQEKLYSKEKCLVPEEFVIETLAKDHENTQIYNSISKGKNSNIIVGSAKLLKR